MPRSFSSAVVLLALGSGVSAQGWHEYEIATLSGVPAAADVGRATNDESPDLVVAVYDDVAETYSIEVYGSSDGAFSWTHSATVVTGLTNVSQIVLGNVNGDQSDDFVVTDVDTGTVHWYRNNFPSYTQNTIATGVTGINDVAIVDVTDDGYGEVVVASEGGLTWYGTTGQPVDSSSWSGTTVQSSIPTLALSVADVNSDTRLDIVALENASTGFGDPQDLTLVWHENLGSGVDPWTGTEVVYSTDTLRVYLDTADIDADGDPDAVVLQDGGGNVRLNWMENDSGSFSPTVAISNGSGAYTQTGVGAGLLDHEVGADVVVVSSGKIEWHANEDGVGGFAEEETVAELLDPLFSVHDVDSDGEVEDIWAVTEVSLVDPPRATWYRYCDHEPVLDGTGGLVARWAFDDPSDVGFDSGPGGHAGSLEGSAAFGTSSLPPIDENVGALELPSNGSYLEVPHHEDLDLTWCHPMSLAFWARRDSTVNGYSVLGKRIPNSEVNYQLVGSSGVWDLMGAQLPEPPLGEWTHLAWSCDGRTTTCYVDGLEVATSDILFFGETSETALFLGSVVALPTSFVGALDDVRLYDRPLTADEVLRLATGDFVRPYGCANPPDTLTLVEGGPFVGQAMTLGIENTEGTQTPATTSPVLIVSVLPDPGFPCGTLIPGWGMWAPGGGDGELLFWPGPPPPSLLPGVPGSWTGPGSPAPFPLSIPNKHAAVGKTVFAQGFLFDTGAASAIAVTNGLEIEIGP